MSPATDSVTTPATGRDGLDACWNRIGVRGDLSCPELKTHIHCRNCAVYSAAAVQLLDVPLPAGHLETWTRHVAQDRQLQEIGRESVVVFRAGAEWLALPTAIVREIAVARAVQPIPHRRGGALLGLANVRGELLVCVSLPGILGLDEVAEHKRPKPRVLEERWLVIQSEGSCAACPIDEVQGIQRFHPRELTAVPATLARATATYTKALLPWQGKSVGLLDEQLLFYTINRSLASPTAT